MSIDAFTKARPRRAVFAAVFTAIVIASVVPATAATQPSPPSPVPSGQTTTTGGFLPAAALTFGSSDTGWASYGGGSVAQTSAVGAQSPGALAVTFQRLFTGASSPRFPVTPGARYEVSGKVLAAGAADSLAMAERYYDGSGQVISNATVVGQALPDSPSSWTQTPTVVGFAPPNAVSADILLLGLDTPQGDVHYLDDVTVAKTTGIAAPVQPPLSTSGQFVLDGNGRQVHFRGIDVNGLQYSNTATVTTDEIAAAQQWGANFIRLPLAENYALQGDCLYDPSYLGKVDTLVNAATSRGMFIMLDLHTQSLQQCDAPAQQLMPDTGALTFWSMVAQRYAANPLVGFDLYNEPHDVIDARWNVGGTFRSNGVTFVSPGMQALYDTVRQNAPTNLIFASGSNWATYYPAAAPLTGTTNLVWAAHAYTCPNGPPDTAKCFPGPGGLYDPSSLLGSWNEIGKTMPVMVTEFGYPSKTEGRYTNAVNNYVLARGWVGWDVYAFDGNSGGMFDLVKDTGPLNDPAPSGMAAIMGMLNT